MRKGIEHLIRAIEAVLVVLLASMAIMVFTNVVLRYGFNKGINISEEVSRYFFVWQQKASSEGIQLKPTNQSP